MISSEVGAVVIGRNEGVRLRQCLESLRGQVQAVIYVDSGSADDSVAVATSLGATVVELSTRSPFTASRARNAGFDRLVIDRPDLGFVQFIDGDCMIQSSWLEAATSFLQDHGYVAVVCGRRRERFPEASPYNRLCDLEWDTPVGESMSCGGDSLMRVRAFRDCGGFDEKLIAGEEPDLCFRLRRAGWKIYRIPAEMTLHDAAMSQLSQWWQRSRRSGFADAEASQRRGKEERHLRRKVRSNLLWGIPLTWPFWPLLWLKVRRRRGSLYATHIVAGKVPHLQGQLSYWMARLRGRQMKIIEYKNSE